VSGLRVLVTDDIDPRGVQLLREAPGVDVVEMPTLSPDRLAAEIGEFDALVGRSATRIPATLLDRASRLRVIGRAGVGIDNIDMDRATELGVAVINVPAGNTVAVAELTMGALLALVRRIPEAAATMRAGRWDRSRLGGVELRGRTLGLIGLGRIGREVARRAHAFDMEVLAYDPYVPAARFADARVERVESVAALADRAQVLSVHAPLTEETREMVDGALLSRLGSEGLLLNFARGGIVVEEALLAALEGGEIAGAAVDAYAVEPLPADHPLRTAPGLLLTPHLGASTAEAQRNVAVEACRAVRDALLTHDLGAAVNAAGMGGARWSELRPLLTFADQLGRLARTLLQGGARRLELRYAGPREDAPRALLPAAVQGALREVVDSRRVNLVNALHVARERDIQCSSTHLSSAQESAEVVELVLEGAEGSARVEGTLHPAGGGRITRIDAFHVDVAPRGTLLILRNRDVPGVIGRVGTVLGEAEVNIAEYHQARLEAGGEALAAVSVDGRLSPDVLATLREIPEVWDARQVAMQ
jgi:D-3-phosphoglycerate dehydrogenase / 2-oxoglutarate reductase